MPEDLRRAGIQPWAWFVNNSVAATHTTAPLLQRRAANEITEIARVVTEYADRHAVVPAQIDDPIGIDVLAALASTQVRHIVSGAAALSPRTTTAM